jgi:hypothetical protein
MRVREIRIFIDCGGSVGKGWYQFGGGEIRLRRYFSGWSKNEQVLRSGCPLSPIRDGENYGIFSGSGFELRV